MINTLKIFLKFNSSFEISLLFFMTVFLSITEAIGFAVLSPFIAFLLNFNDNFLTSSNNFFVANVVNSFDVQNKYSFLKTYVIFIFIYYLFKFIFSLLFVIYNSVFVYKFRDNLQKEILRKFVTRPYEFHLNFDSTDKVRFTSDEIGNYFNLVIIPYVLLTAEIFIIISLSIFAFFYSPTFFILFLVFSLLIILIVQTIRSYLKKIGQIRLLNELNRHQILQQIFTGIKDVIIFSKEKEFMNQNSILTNKVSDSDKRYLIMESLPRHIIEIITIFIFCFFFYFFLKDTNFNFQNVVPKVAIYTLIFFRIIPSFTKIARGISSMSYAKDIEKKIYNYLSLKEDTNENQIKYDFKKNIRIKYLDFKFDKSDKILRYNSDIDIKKGHFTCIFGESGVGKTTLFDIVSGLLMPRKADVYVDDIKVVNFPLKLNSKIGIVHQNFFLFNDSLLSNITFLKKENVDLNFVNELLKLVLLDEFVKKLPNGLDSQIGEIGNKLSGGQKQRIAIARSLYQKPDFLLFDEATSALDSTTEYKLLQNLKEKYEKKITFVSISHKTSNKEIFDNIIEIKNT